MTRRPAGLSSSSSIRTMASTPSLPRRNRLRCRPSQPPGERSQATPPGRASKKSLCLNRYSAQKGDCVLIASRIAAPRTARPRAGAPTMRFLHRGVEGAARGVGPPRATSPRGPRRAGCARWGGSRGPGRSPGQVTTTSSSGSLTASPCRMPTSCRRRPSTSLSLRRSRPPLPLRAARIERGNCWSGWACWYCCKRFPRFSGFRRASHRLSRRQRPRQPPCPPARPRICRSPRRDGLCAVM
jgi:hypothetical protein